MDVWYSSWMGMQSWRGIQLGFSRLSNAEQCLNASVEMDNERAHVMESEGSGMVATDPEIFDIGGVKVQCACFVDRIHDGNNTWTP